MVRKIVLILMTLCLVGGLASAHEQRRLDANDTDGPLDIRRARVKHGDQKYRFKIVTHDRWRPRALRGSSNFLSFELDAEGDGHSEWCAVVTSVQKPEGGYKLSGRLHWNASGCDYFTDDLFSFLNVWRSDRRSVTVVVPANTVLALKDEFTWRAATAFDRPDHAECPSPEPHGDGGYGTCTDFTKPKTHTPS